MSNEVTTKLSFEQIQNGLMLEKISKILLDSAHTAKILEKAWDQEYQLFGFTVEMTSGIDHWDIAKLTDLGVNISIYPRDSGFRLLFRRIIK